MGTREPGLPAGTGARVAVAVAAAVLLPLFAFNVAQGYFLGDDAYISFRYAAHLAEGQGLTWNPGERVEGYTNFLWVLLMAAAIALGGAPEIVSNVIGIAAGAGLVMATLAFAARAYGWTSPLAWLPAFALAAGRSFTAWCTGGLETMLFALLVFLAFASFVRERSAGRDPALVSSLLLALATLTRPEGGLFAVVLGLFLLADVVAGRRSIRALVVWTLPYAAVVGAHLLWRYGYYGYWLPNSFYAKVPGAWWDQGLRYLGLFLGDTRLAWFLPLPLLAAIRGRFEHRLFLVAIALYTLYVAWVGGDRFEFRFMVVALPFLYCLMAEGLRQVGSLVPDGASSLRIVPTLAGASLLLTTALGSRGPEADGRRHGVAGLGTIRDYAESRAEEGRFLRELIDAGDLPRDLVLCVGGAGAVPYYTDWPTVDRRGINDVAIAHAPLAERGEVAHERDAPYAYLARRGVVIFDVFNRIVHEGSGRPGWIEHDGVILPVKVVRARGRELRFATLVPEAEFARIFGRLEIVGATAPEPTSAPAPGTAARTPRSAGR